jgi:hypothetical protein
MDIHSKQSADAEETCKLLEQAILKYFPRPIEKTDSAASDEAVEPQSGSRPETSTSTVLVAVRRGLSFLCLPHSF